MLCRIADPHKATPITWRALDSSRSKDAAPGPSACAPPPSDADELQQRLQELEKIRQVELGQAKQTAFQEGRNKGREDGADQIKAAVDRLAHRLNEMSTLRKRIRDQAEADIVKLGLAIARRILRRELAMDPEAVQGVVHAALQRIQNRDLLRVRIYPEGAEALTQTLRSAAAPSSVQVVSDPTLKLGDVFFETSAGELNASVETQLQEVERGLTDRLARQS